MVRAIARPGLTTENASVEEAVAAMREHVPALRDALVALLTDAATLGAKTGLAQVERILGVKGGPGPSEGKPAEIQLTNWDLVNQAVLRWILGDAPGLGRGYADGVVISLVRTREEHIRTAMAEWIQNGLPRTALVEMLTEPLLSRDRAEMVAATEATRAYSQGNIEAWRASGVVTGMEWRTANDEDVCPICAPLGGLGFGEDGADPTSLAQQDRRAVSTSLDGEFTHPGGRGAAGNFEGQTFGPPPAHPRCRCWPVPVVE